MTNKCLPQIARKTGSKVPWKVVRSWSSRRARTSPTKQPPRPQTQKRQKRKAPSTIIDDSDAPSPLATSTPPRRVRTRAITTSEREAGVDNSDPVPSNEAANVNNLIQRNKPVSQDHVGGFDVNPKPPLDTGLHQDLAPQADEPLHMLQMLHRIIMHMRKSHERDWTTSFTKADYEFADAVSTKLAHAILRERGMKQDRTSALDILRYAYMDMAENGPACDVRYHEILLLFTGQVDSHVQSNRPARPRPKVQVWHVVASMFPNQHPLYPNQLYHLNAESFFASFGLQVYSEWRTRYSTYFERAPYMLRGDGWMLFWGLLLFSRTELVQMLRNVGVGVGGEWAGKGTQTLLVEMYMRETCDGREAHAVRETLHMICRVFKRYRMRISN